MCTVLIPINSVEPLISDTYVTQVNLCKNCKYSSKVILLFDKQEYHTADKIKDNYKRQSVA